MGDSVKFSTSLNSNDIVVTLEVPELDVEHESNLVLDVFPRECIFTAAPYHARIPLKTLVKPGKAFPENVDYEKNTVSFRISLEGFTSENASQSDTFRYGFCQFYSGVLALESSQELIILMNPESHSPSDRMKIMQEAEKKDFHSEHYGMDHIQFQIDKLGVVLNTPLLLPKLSEEQCYRVSVILEEKQRQIDLYTSVQDHAALLLGLIDILLAVCYDRLTNGNELNEANSHVNVQRISATLSYFIEFDSIAEVLRSFYRRSCTYPFYRCKEISQVCVEKLLTSMKSFDRRAWIRHELLYTYNIFKTTDCAVLNHYYLKDYIRYIEHSMNEELLADYLKEMEKLLPVVHQQTLGFGEETTVEKLIKDILALEETDLTDSDDFETEDEESDSCTNESDPVSSAKEENPSENVLEKLMNLNLSG